MSEDLPDFMSDEPALAPEPQADPQAPNPQETPAVEAPQEPTAPAAVDQPAPEPQQADQQQGDPPAPAHAPLTALLDERERRQAAERERDNLRRWKQEQDAKNAPQVPDRYDDPEGYEQHQRAALALDMFVQRRDTSRMVAEMQHGEETVKAAFDWAGDICERNPAFNQRVLAAANPAGFMVKAYQEYQRAQEFADVDPTDFKAFREWKAAQAGGPAPGPGPAAAPPATGLPPPLTPPRSSIATAPNAGDRGQPVAVDGETTFNDMFAPR